MTIKEFQGQVDAWIKTYGVRYYHELTNVALLMEEVGELSKLTACSYGEHSFKPGTEPPDIKLALADEMGDILFVLACLANQMEIDLEEAVTKSLAKKSSRDKDRHHQNPKLHKGGET